MNNKFSNIKSNRGPPGFNKRAQIGEMTYIIPYFIVFAMVGGAVVISAAMFFGAEYDYRSVDANLLNNHIQNCLADNNPIFPISNEEFITKCNLNKKLVNEFLLINIKEGDNVLIHLGKDDVSHCLLEKKNPAFPACIEKQLDLNGQTLTILTGSAQRREKIVEGVVENEF